MLTNTPALEALFRTNLRDLGLHVKNDDPIFTIVRSNLEKHDLSEEDVDDALLSVASMTPVGRSKTVFTQNFAEWASKKEITSLSAERVAAYLTRHIVHRMVDDQRLVDRHSEPLRKQDIPVQPQCEERAMLTGIAAAMRKRHFKSPAQTLMRDVWISDPSIKGAHLARIVREAGLEMSESFAARFIKSLQRDARNSFQGPDQHRNTPPAPTAPPQDNKVDYDCFQNK